MRFKLILFGWSLVGLWIVASGGWSEVDAPWNALANQTAEQYATGYLPVTLDSASRSDSPVEHASGSDWPVWRGPSGKGIAPGQQTPPIEWSETDPVLWRTPLPGRGHASPTIVGQQIFLAAADAERQTQSVICLDRQTGRQLWQTVIHQGGLRNWIHQNNTRASSTIACDGQRLFVLFENRDAIHLTALDRQGEILWQRETGEYDPAYPFGYGASPLIEGNLVIVTGENPNGYLVAYDRRSGEEVWRVERPRAGSYSSPIVAEIAGRRLMLLSGNQRVAAFDPTDGELIWEAPAEWQVTCGTVVWEGEMVFASGGFPGGQTLAIDGRTWQMVWDNGVQCYEQSLLVHDGYLYAVSDQGIAYCWRAADGEEMWRERFFVSRRDGSSASPVLVGDTIYVSIESGLTFVYRANPDQFELLAKNQLGDSAFATPTFLDNRIYARVGDGDQEWLYCLGK